ncbi:MAG: nucleotidyltransferase domain-containing protein [Candidatus Aenigmarchaeota archaeon]|nr:nucleotidyltransferase domain-containing protein [Candidatus Aenigmarchaeota archaeon]
MPKRKPEDEQLPEDKNISSVVPSNPEPKLETKEKRMELVNHYAKKVLDKYGQYIKAIVMMGSVVREEFKPKSDIDIFVVVDDATFDLTSELLDKIDADLLKMADDMPDAWISVKTPDGKEEKINLLSIQPVYTLTEFWDYARVAHPIIYNFIKEGMPIYDTGFFAPIKRLLEMGKIPATREAIESYMEGAPKKLNRAKTVKLLMLAEDCYYAILNSSQAVLMFMGLAPPVPSKAYDEVVLHLVKPGILEQQYADWLRDIIEIRKKIEHKELMDVSGAVIDEWIDKSEKFVDKMFGLLNALEIRKKEKILERTHDVMYKAAITAIKSLKKMPESMREDEVAKRVGNVSEEFKKEFIDTRLVEPYYLDVWNRIEQMKKLSGEKKITEIPDREVYEMREYVRKLIRDLAKVLKDKGISEEESEQ